MPAAQSIFDGDGRTTILPTVGLPGTQATPIYRTSARAIIDRFITTGKSVHSIHGGTLWVILQHCAESRTPYRLRADPELGYMVEKTTAEPTTYEQWEAKEGISSVSPEAYYAERAWNAALGIKS